MLELNRALYVGMPAGDARWMEDYLRRVRAAEPTGSQDDARGMGAMAAAVNRLPELSRERLRLLVETAIVAALEPRPTPVGVTTPADEALEGDAAGEPAPTDAGNESDTGSS
jgi:hypothetical protein